MIKNVLIALLFGLLVTGCGGSSSKGTAQEDTPIVDGGIMAPLLKMFRILKLTFLFLK